MNQEHHKKDIRTNNVGATHDIDKELSGVQNKGTYFDSQNGRISSDRGNKGSWEKIRGEEIVFNNPTTDDYFCLCSISVHKDVFQVWVEKTQQDDPIIVINGDIMGKSPDMPWLYEYRIQFDVNENCIGGEVFLTDFNVAPMIFNIKDIKDNFDNNTQKYFSDFNPELYYINLSSPLDIPVFKELVLVGGGGGLPVGSYQYSLRYSNDEGDKTNWGVSTPPIPVLESVQGTSSPSPQYFGVKSYGNVPNINFKTSYGVKLKFRVTNLNNYQYIEIRRIDYKIGAGIDFVPNGVLVAKIPISPGEISIREFIDPVDANISEETLADNEDNYELSNIQRAKAIRYYDKKLVLMNYEVQSKEVDVNIDDINGEKIIPILKDLGKNGFNSPLNHTYNKNYQSGDKYSFGINFFDGGGGAGFVYEDDDLKNIQVPNRRDLMSNDSIDLSVGGQPIAAANTIAAGKVFEIFDHDDAIGKSDEDTIKNISYDGSKNGENASDVGYKPLRPVNKNDSIVDHNYRINTGVRDSSNTLSPYDPQCFNLDYYTKGFAIGAVKDIPDWVKSFSVVRTDRAKRVVCQGIGMYSLQEGDFNTFGGSVMTSKFKDKLWFHSPDIESGIVSSAVIQDMIDNPSSYQIQFVSPLGFFSEVYNFNNKALLPNRDRIIDMITYARIQHDEGQINTNEVSNVGGIGFGGKRYITHNRYRNTSDAAYGDAFATPELGNTLFNLDNFSIKTSGRSTYYEIGLDQDVYNRDEVGPGGVIVDNDFDDQEMKDFTEPFYIINIIQVGKEVPDLNINNYKSTGHYQKIKSIIGVGSGEANQLFELVDERWEDCCPSLLSTDYNSAGESVIYLENENGEQRAFLNVTHLSGGAIASIVSDITTNGFYATVRGIDVVGIYTHIVNSDGSVSILFGNGYNPDLGEKIVVMYDDTRPIVFFGGDTVVGENIFAPIDNEADASFSDRDGQFIMNIGFPYRRYDLNTNYFITEDTSSNNIQSSDRCRIGYLRQLCVMYAVESTIASQFSFNTSFSLQHFPLIHYVMRPNEFDSSSFESGDLDDISNDNEIFRKYFDDYPEEYTIWKYGGFRFLPQTNIDYSAKGPVIGFSKPDVGFKEETLFCTGIKWSLSRATNQQDSPGLKTFIAGNTFIADDDNGAIVKAWDALGSDKGENLYAITKTGILLLLTKKSILSNLQGEDLSTTSFDNFIGGQFWLSREIGSNDEMWRGMAESSVELSSEMGKIEAMALYIPNSQSIYRLMNNQITDIAKDNYLSRMIDSLQAILPEYETHVIGHFDKAHNEYWLQIPDEKSAGKATEFVFSQDTNMFIGRFTYSFDSYLYQNSKNYGFKDLSMFELNKGYQIDNESIEAYLIQHTSIELVEEKEFISIEVNTGLRGTMKPTEIIFLDENENELCRLNQSLFGVRYLKQYNGWWNQIPRKEISASANRDRVQYRLLMYKIIHTFEEDFKIVSSVIQYKNIK